MASYLLLAAFNADLKTMASMPFRSMSVCTELNLHASFLSMVVWELSLKGGPIILVVLDGSTRYSSTALPRISWISSLVCDAPLLLLLLLLLLLGPLLGFCVGSCG
jgi:hypothetical protein